VSKPPARKKRSHTRTRNRKILPRTLPFQIVRGEKKKKTKKFAPPRGWKGKEEKSERSPSRQSFFATIPLFASSRRKKMKRNFPREGKEKKPCSLPIEILTDLSGTKKKGGKKIFQQNKKKGGPTGKAIPHYLPKGKLNRSRRKRGKGKKKTTTPVT